MTCVTDDKKLTTTLKRIGVTNIPAIEEVNMFKNDGEVIHFVGPKGESRRIRTHTTPIRVLLLRLGSWLLGGVVVQFLGSIVVAHFGKSVVRQRPVSSSRGGAREGVIRFLYSSY